MRALLAGRLRRTKLPRRGAISFLPDTLEIGDYGPAGCSLDAAVRSFNNRWRTYGGHSCTICHEIRYGYR